jgi:hypothetical protein
MRQFWRKGPTIDPYQGINIRVRGWLKKFNGAMIEASHLDKIKNLKWKNPVNL